MDNEPAGGPQGRNGGNAQLRLAWSQVVIAHRRLPAE